MFYRLPDGSYRLFRPGDAAHPRRTGKITPDRDALPPECHDILDWYEDVYCGPQSATEDNDPVIGMIGAGKHLWQDESGDEFVRRERSGWDVSGGE